MKQTCKIGGAPAPVISYDVPLATKHMETGTWNLSTLLCVGALQWEKQKNALHIMQCSWMHCSHNFAVESSWRNFNLLGKLENSWQNWKDNLYRGSRRSSESRAIWFPYMFRQNRCPAVVKLACTVPRDLFIPNFWQTRWTWIACCGAPGFRCSWIFLEQPQTKAYMISDGGPVWSTWTDGCTHIHMYYFFKKWMYIYIIYNYTDFYLRGERESVREIARKDEWWWLRESPRSLFPLLHPQISLNFIDEPSCSIFWRSAVGGGENESIMLGAIRFWDIFGLNEQACLAMLRDHWRTYHLSIICRNSSLPVHIAYTFNDI